jgi:iron complex outermembrane receptor protein
MTEPRRFTPERWRYALVSALLASASALPVYAASAPSDSTVAEVIVTATKRSENLQSVPVSIQALTPKILSDHQVLAFDDYAKLLPSVSFQSFGPGQSQLYFRGIASGGDGLHGGSLPATGVYVDEIPVTTIGNAVDMHMYDISRVEALAGPQGTLYGASSLSGTLRIITNKPDPNKFAAGFDVTGDTFTDGAPGGVFEGFLNIPINSRAAIRLVGFDEHDGGYIDSVFKERTFTLDQDPDNFPGAPATLTTNNAKYVKKDYNTVDTYGGRIALKVDLNDSWTVSPGVIYQHQDSHGGFLYNPALGFLKNAAFAPERNLDTWYQAYLTIQGKIGNWDVLYAGGYFGRTVDNQSDYSYYAVGYDSQGATSAVTFPDGHGGYLNPNQHFTGNDVYTKQTHEFRVSSPAQYRLRGVAGVFWQQQTDAITANYLVPGLGATEQPIIFRTSRSSARSRSTSCRT